MAGMVFDARDGLSLAMLDDLRAAHRVVIALKDMRACAVGYWIDKQDRQPQAGDDFGIVILPAKVSLTHGHAWSNEQPLTIANAQHDRLWQTALSHVHPGDVATIQWVVGWAAVSLSVAKRRASAHAGGSWGLPEYQKWTVPVSKQYLWAGAHLLPDFVATYFLGHTTDKPRWRGERPSTGGLRTG